MKTFQEAVLSEVSFQDLENGEAVFKSTPYLCFSTISQKQLKISLKFCVKKICFIISYDSAIDCNRNSKMRHECNLHIVKF